MRLILLLLLVYNVQVSCDEHDPDVFELTPTHATPIKMLHPLRENIAGSTSTQTVRQPSAPQVPSEEEESPELNFDTEETAESDAESEEDTPTTTLSPQTPSSRPSPSDATEEQSESAEDPFSTNASITPGKQPNVGNRPTNAPAPKTSDGAIEEQNTDETGENPFGGDGSIFMVDKGVTPLFPMVTLPTGSQSDEEDMQTSTEIQFPPSRPAAGIQIPLTTTVAASESDESLNFSSEESKETTTVSTTSAPRITSPTQAATSATVVTTSEIEAKTQKILPTEPIHPVTETTKSIEASTNNSEAEASTHVAGTESTEETTEKESAGDDTEDTEEGEDTQMFKTPDDLFTVGGSISSSTSAASATKQEATQQITTTTSTEAENPSTGQSTDVEPMQTLSPTPTFVNPQLFPKKEEKPHTVTEEKSNADSEEGEKDETTESTEEVADTEPPVLVQETRETEEKTEPVENAEELMKGADVQETDGTEGKEQTGVQSTDNQAVEKNTSETIVAKRTPFSLRIVSIEFLPDFLESDSGKSRKLRDQLLPDLRTMFRSMFTDFVNVDVIDFDEAPKGVIVNGVLYTKNSVKNAETAATRFDELLVKRTALVGGNEIDPLSVTIDGQSSRSVLPASTSSSGSNSLLIGAIVALTVLAILVVAILTIARFVFQHAERKGTRLVTIMEEPYCGREERLLFGWSRHTLVNCSGQVLLIESNYQECEVQLNTRRQSSLKLKDDRSGRMECGGLASPYAGPPQPMAFIGSLPPPLHPPSSTHLPQMVMIGDSQIVKLPDNSYPQHYGDTHGIHDGYYRYKAHY